MKKGIAVLLGAAMILSMAACGNKKTEDNAGTAETTGAVETESSASEETDAAAEMPEYVSAFDLGAIADYVELGEYKGIQVAARSTEVTDEEVEEELQSQVENAAPAYQEVTEGTVAEGDVANIDFVGKMDGVAFEGGTGSDFNLTIGSGQFIPGFEDGLIGKNIGDTVVLDLTFPEDYSTAKPELNGKAVEFTVTINYGQGEEIPNELNDAFVERITAGAYHTVEEYRAYLKEDLAASKVDDAKTARINEAWEKILANTTFKKDAEELITYINDNQLYQFENTLVMYGMTMESYLDTMGTTEEEFMAELNDYSKQNAQTQLLIRAIVEAENLDLSDSEYEAGLEDLAEQTGISLDTLKTSYPERMLKDILRQQRVQEFLEKTIVEVAAEE